VDVGQIAAVVSVACVIGCGAGAISAGSETTTSGSESESTSESETGEFTCAPWVESPIAGFEGRGPVVADIDGDGHLDLVGLHLYTSELEFAWGDGQGGFAHELGLPFGEEIPGARRLLVGDLDADGRQDLAVFATGTRDTSGAVTRLQSSPRAFGSAHASMFVGEWEYWEIVPAVLSDVDLDGAEDLVVGHAAWPADLNLSTALADGTGHFGQPLLSSLLVWCYTKHIAAGDFDGSGDDEFVLLGPWTCNGANDPTLMVVVDLDAAGEVTILSTLDAGYEPNTAAVADFDGDGWLDFAVVNQYDISIFRGLGDGSFESRPRIDVTGDDESQWGSPASWVVDGLAGDFDGDGAVELFVVTDASEQELSARLVDDPLGSVLVQPLGPFPSAPALAGDFDEDGCDDLLFFADDIWTLRRCAGECGA
jgi:hypothetical protein